MAYLRIKKVLIQETSLFRFEQEIKEKLANNKNSSAGNHYNNYFVDAAARAKVCDRSCSRWHLC